MKSMLIRLGLHISCLIPISVVTWMTLTDNAGANPIEYITHETGSWTIRLLLLTLTVRPLAQLINQPVLISYRRALGLYTFVYSICHFITYIWLDQFFDWEEIIFDIAERPFILAGFTAFVLLIPLALTSNRWSVVRMGRYWKILHRLVYIIVIAGLLHYWWQTRADFVVPSLYLVILIILFSYRIYRYIIFKRRRS